MKKYFKIIIVLLVTFFIQSKANSQANNIEIAPYIAESVDGIPIEAHQTLLNKMGEILTMNGIIKGINSNFILTCNSTVSNEVITSTAPTLHIYEISATFYIGNGVDGTLFSSFNTTLKGSGASKTKAYIDAFKGLKSGDKQFHSFIENAKQKIVTYYNTKCASIMEKVNTLDKTQLYEEASYILSSIPDASSCYTQAQQKMITLYQRAIDNDCKIKLANATNIWASHPNEYGANKVSNILSSINPNAACFAQVKVLGAEVEKKMLENDKREFEIRYEQEVGLEKDRIEAIKEIGKAYGNGQPKNITYNVRWW